MFREEGLRRKGGGVAYTNPNPMESGEQPYRNRRGRQQQQTTPCWVSKGRGKGGARVVYPRLPVPCLSRKDEVPKDEVVSLCLLSLSSLLGLPRMHVAMPPGRC